MVVLISISYFAT